jgi:hypothetical protein
MLDDVGKNRPSWTVLGENGGTGHVLGEVAWMFDPDAPI